MANKKKLFGLLILVFGLTIVGCASTTSTGGIPIKAADIVGEWDLYEAVNVSRESIIQRAELFGHGSGIFYLYDGNLFLATWRIRQGNRFQRRIQSANLQETYDVELSEDGMFLTFFYDGRDFEGANPRKGIYRRDDGN